MSKSNTTICAAKNCYSSIVTHPSKSFFGFPSDIALSKKWLENCGRTDNNLHQVSKLKHWRLCEDHFEEEWFTDKSKKVLRRKLKPVPTIFVNNINSLLPQQAEPEFICDTKPILKSVELSSEVSKETPLDFISHSGMKNIDTICRFCLSDVSSNYVNMFSESDDARGIRKIIKVILQRKVSVYDGLPYKVCQKCTVDLKTCWKLIEQFQNADQYLRSIARYSLLIGNGKEVNGKI